MDSMPTIFTTIWATAVAVGCTASLLMVVAALMLATLFVVHEIKKHDAS